MNKLGMVSLSLFAAGMVSCAPRTVFTPVKAPAELAAPTGYQAYLQLLARGVQLYICQAKADNSGYEWAFKAPLADLFDDEDTKVGTHGAGPFWMYQDGSKIIGEVKARVNSTDSDAIPWLLLAVKSREGKGLLSNASYVQRLETEGGKAPNTACNATTNLGKEAKVDYIATYVYFQPN